MIKGTRINFLFVNNIESNFHISSFPVVLIGRILGVFPVQDGSTQIAKTLQFKWTSLHTIRSLLSILLITAMAIISVEWLLNDLSVPRASLYYNHLLCLALFLLSILLVTYIATVVIAQVKHLTKQN